MARSRPAQRQSLRAPELSSWAEGLPERFLACRDFGHSWRSYSATFSRAERQYRRELHCSRCRTGKVQWLTITGHVESTHYVYPDGYNRPAASGAYDASVRDLIRLTHLTNALETAVAS
jgi:hypothetical protein